MKIYATLAILATTQAFSANLIENGQFESPVATTAPVTSYPTIPGWSPSGTATAIYVVPDNTNFGNWPTRGQGGAGQFVDIGNTPGTGMFQTVVVPVDFGLSEVSWYDATSTLAPGISTYSVHLLNSLNELVLSGSYGTSLNSWSLKTLAAPSILTPGTYTLQFEPTSGAGNKDTLIDNVQFVPEPGSSLLLSVFLGCSAFRRRRLR